MVEPKCVHWIVVKLVLRYLQGTINYGLKYVQQDEVKIKGFIHANWAGNIADRKSTSGYNFNLGSGAVSWYRRKQKLVALNSAEAEYMAASMDTCEAIWLQKLLAWLFDQELDPAIIYYDNQSCIKLSENPLFHDKSKHIEIKYHFIRDCVEKGIVKLQYIPTDKQIADILTKALIKNK
ncbi:secreted RxLR effector protein 161-like [Cryptomeria japonica]|uniref:secreted RxLR effector protein 161-like n=1 Tax=Cryptomeria japonica TaxID=3369 RepID=UPI0027DAAE40|nr:secreted RxLR effector protein 161-like [Cryptomeria japonica]